MKIFRVARVIAAFVALGLVLTLGAGLGAAEQEKEEEENIRFLWAFGAIQKGEGEAKLIPIARDTALESGDQIKFFVKPKEKCFVYLIYHSSQGELSVLFPYRFEQLSRGYPKEEEYYIPKGTEWFELDEHVGQETFYLLASSERLYDLEALINTYETADPAKKPEIANKALKEIRMLIRKNRKFKGFAEKPVTIIGHLRGSEKVEVAGTPDVTDLAVEISGSKFYSRTFTIDHK
ncbi:MAG: DUF4384 domain-containing protein [Desulfobacteraceae bacterium]